MKKIIFLFLPLILLGVGCSSDQYALIKKQQAQIDKLMTALDEKTSSTAALENKVNQLQNDQSAQAQLQTEKTKNNRLRASCLYNADLEAVTDFQVLCRTDVRINGGDIQTACNHVMLSDAIGYMTVAAYNRIPFDAILKQRQQSRDECIKLYQ